MFDYRSDTFDILHYEINAQFTGQQMNASTSITVLSLEKAQSIDLDLLGLTVDSVHLDGLPTSFNQKDPLVNVILGGIEKGDTLDVTVYYHGSPVKDAQWGGFYFSGVYSFNLGVGFAADPHTFGRVWFPCFDNFTDRATYTYKIEVDSQFKALCNGSLVSVQSEGAQKTYHWEMRDPIPTYLSSVAIAPYELVEFTVSGIPVILAAIESDTANMMSSFRNLEGCVDGFEKAYGEHSFERIGFNMVPFNGGAMEHATNIAYPLFGISNGNLNYETLYAHELSHHWWGNTVTCRTQEDMWLNEGWASYSERIFLESVYGRQAYLNDVRANHKAVVHYAHIRDGKSLPVSGIGHANTYGMHVYDKGADMVHTLRGIMGDSAFFDACVSYQKEFKFKDASTDDLFTHFQKYTSYDLGSFKEQWILEAGFPQFFIQGVEHLQDSYEIRIKQNQRFNNVEYTNMVHYVSAFSSDLEEKEFKIEISGQDVRIKIPKSELAFYPVYWALDFNERISDAITDQWMIIDSVRSINFADALFKAEVQQTAGSSLFRVEHHWVSPDHYFMKMDGIVLSSERYWTVDGIWNDSLIMSATFEYNGLAPYSNPATGFLDNQLITKVEDSLVLLYRPNAWSDWEIYPEYDKVMGSVYNKKGVMIASNLRKGQYAFGIYDSENLHVEECCLENPIEIKVYPNPTEEEIKIDLLDNNKSGFIELTNSQGQVVKTLEIKKRDRKVCIDVSGLPKGVYFVGMVLGGSPYESTRVVIK